LTALARSSRTSSARLDEAADARLAARGYEQPLLDDDEIDELMQSLRQWTERDDDSERPTPPDG
jgi:hypothetical protein